MNGVIDGELAVSATIWLFGGAAAGMLLGPLAGWWWRTPKREGFMMGLMVGMLLLAAAALTGAARLAQAAWQFHAASLPAQGVLESFVAQKRYDSKKRREVTSRHPRLVFSTPDGQQHSFTGLAGSLQAREPGSAVAIRYRADRPAVAAVADFQSQWGAAWGFGLFGGAAAWVALAASLGLNPAQPGGVPRAPTGAWARWCAEHGERPRREFGRIGKVMLLAAVVSPLLGWTEDVGAAIATALCGVGSAMLCMAISKLFVPQDAPVRSAALGLGAAAGFFYFGLGVWALTRP